MCIHAHSHKNVTVVFGENKNQHIARCGCTLATLSAPWGAGDILRTGLRSSKWIFCVWLLGARCSQPPEASRSFFDREKKRCCVHPHLYRNTIYIAHNRDVEMYTIVGSCWSTFMTYWLDYLQDQVTLPSPIIAYIEQDGGCTIPVVPDWRMV